MPTYTLLTRTYVSCLSSILLSTEKEIHADVDIDKDMSVDRDVDDICTV